MQTHPADHHSMRVMLALVLFLYASATGAVGLEHSKENDTVIETEVQLEKGDPTQNETLDDRSGIPSTRYSYGHDLDSIATRLAASEKMIQNLQMVLNQKFNQQKSAIDELSSMLTQMGSKVEQLNTALKNQPKVAFSASLYSTGEKVFGPFPGDTNLVFRSVLTNVGNAYSPASGIFEAPVKGVYYFRFTAFGLSKNYRRVCLVKNGQQIVTVTDSRSSKDPEDASSNAAVLELNRGDEVHLVLRNGFAVYDDGNRHTTFSGFLLFTQP